MTQYITNCPRCGANNSTHDCLGSVILEWVAVDISMVEVFLKGRCCSASHVRKLLLERKDFSSHCLNADNGLVGHEFTIDPVLSDFGPISIIDTEVRIPPKYLPEEVEKILSEGHKCLSIRCYNAAGACYRLVLDIVSKNEVVAIDPTKLSSLKTIHQRVEWLAKEEHFPPTLKELADCIRHDGNDAAHDGSLTEIDAEELADFTEEFLTRVYTDRRRLELAAERRAKRREGRS